eukprot:m.726878 g.726878  ORF g.726878 m.726878 type:complete len:74 (-) comp58860_c0_seq26:174-395(-)
MLVVADSTTDPRGESVGSDRRRPSISVPPVFTQAERRASLTPTGSLHKVASAAPDTPTHTTAKCDWLALDAAD